MRIIGVDYGSKRVGLSVSDETGTIASPYKVIPPRDAAAIITVEANSFGASIIVIGESRDLGGRENPILGEIHKLKKSLEDSGFEVVLEPEYWTSVEAARFQGKTDLLDSSAAAIILQRYLDKNKRR